MRKSLVSVLILIVTFIPIFSSNLLLNSDFESWSDSLHPAFWYQDSTYRDSFRCVVSANNYSGTYSFVAHVFTKVQGLTDVVSEFISILPNTTYRIKAYVLDNENDLYSKIYLNYYDLSYGFVGNNFNLDSVGDNSSWQIFPETLITTPSSAYFAKVGFRFYDTGIWNGFGEIFIDSAYFGDTISAISVNTPPQFSSLTHTPAVPVSLQKATASCIITDNGSVAADSLFYRVNSGSWVKVFRDSLVGNTRYYSIPGQSASSTVQYYAWAKDNEGLIAVSDTNSYVVGTVSHTSVKKVLFDYTKNQTAGEADWIIDTNWPVPLPADPSAEDDWVGGISSWGFELDTARIYNSQTASDTITFEVYTLPPDSPITYGTTRPMDLKNYDVYIVCEPQNPFSSAESTAIFNYVANGGGLFMVADHVSSDRDGDGWDSPQIWDALGSDNFGMHFYQVGEGNNNLSVSTSTYNTSNDTITGGPFGSVIGGTYNFHAGTMIQQSASALEVALYNTNYSMLSVAFYGSHNGRVAGTGDSSPCDDSTGQAGNTLYDGWNEGIDRRLILNATYWLSIDSLDYAGSSAVDASYSADGEDVRISLSIDRYKEFSSIIIMRKLKNEDEFTKTGSILPSARILFTDKLPGGYFGSATYRIIGTGNSTEELAMFDVRIEKRNALKGTIFASADFIRGDFEGTYRIMDVTGREVLKCVPNGAISIKGLRQGIYYLESVETGERVKIVRIK